MTSATTTPGALMFAEAASAHEAVSEQLACPQFAELGARLRALAPRAVATCARGSSDHAATFAKYLIETRAGVLTTSVALWWRRREYARVAGTDTSDRVTKPG